MTVQEQKKYIHKKATELLTAEATPKNIKIVAEGDSWFDYPLSKDIIDWLMIQGYVIKNFATHGDILENMVYGTEIKENTSSKKSSLEKTLDAIAKVQPGFVLLSGGGNDVVGENMIQFLNHKKAGEPLFRRKAFVEHINGYVKNMIRYFCQQVWAIDDQIHILMDGYAYARANGKKYNRLWINWAGPWILPGMHKKNIFSSSDHESIIREMVDIFNDMLAIISDKYPHFHHIDLRSLFPREEQWDNEIHLTDQSYRIAATVYHHHMKILHHHIETDLNRRLETVVWPDEVLV